jgi:hypothetical protein
MRRRVIRPGGHGVGVPRGAAAGRLGSGRGERRDDATQVTHVLRGQERVAVQWFEGCWGHYLL